MTKHVPPPVIDFLSQAIEHVRLHLDRSLPIGQRARNFWAGVVAARDLAAFDVVEQEFATLARTTRVTSDLGPTDVAHLLRWGLLDRNPFC